jgi:hypothetical protein
MSMAKIKQIEDRKSDGGAEKCRSCVHDANDTSQSKAQNNTGAQEIWTWMW